MAELLQLALGGAKRRILDVLKGILENVAGGRVGGYGASVREAAQVAV